MFSDLPWPGGGARPWQSGAGGKESCAGPPFRGQVRATFFATSTTWPRPGAAARPGDIRERPLDIRERPLDSRQRPLDFRKRWGGVGWGGAGWGGDHNPSY